MKKTILAIAFIIFSMAGARAQTSFGLKGGITSSNLKGYEGGMSISLTSKIGFYAGAFAEVGVSENFAIQPEVLYSVLGAKLNLDSVHYKEDVNYMNIPVLAKYKNGGFSIQAGPQIGLLISAKDSNGKSIKDEYNTTDFSVIVGAGYTLFNGLGADARYQIGLGNVARNSGSTSVKSNAFYIGLHYKFRKCSVRCQQCYLFNRRVKYGKLFRN